MWHEPSQPAAVWGGLFCFIVVDAKEAHVKNGTTNRLLQPLPGRKLARHVVECFRACKLLLCLIVWSVLFVRVHHVFIWSFANRILTIVLCLSFLKNSSLFMHFKRFFNLFLYFCFSLLLILIVVFWRMCLLISVYLLVNGALHDSSQFFVWSLTVGGWNHVNTPYKTVLVW